MLESIHFLVSYACNFECDHCFLFAGPRAGGAFRIEQIERILDEAAVLGIRKVCFEGGEPMLHYPLVVEAVRQARARGMESGIVTNAYWATSDRDAELWLRPLAELGVKGVGLSDDALHYGESAGPHAERVMEAAKRLGMTANVMRTETPRVEQTDSGPAVCGGVMFRGRAAVKMAAGLPTRPWESFTRCGRENLADPKRVHVDSFGNIHLCQGLSMGNFWRRPLSELVRSFDGLAHPIAGPILRGGPAELVRAFDLPHSAGYVDECHLCFEARLALLDRFPEFLAPRLVYGLE